MSSLHVFVFAYFVVVVLSLLEKTRPATSNGSESYLLGLRKPTKAKVSISLEASCLASSKDEFDNRLIFCYEKVNTKEFQCDKETYDLRFSQPDGSTLAVNYRGQDSQTLAPVNGTYRFDFDLDLGNGTNASPSMPKLTNYEHWDGSYFYALRYALVRRGDDCNATISFLNKDASNPAEIIEQLKRKGVTVPSLTPEEPGTPLWIIILPVSLVAFVVLDRLLVRHQAQEEEEGDAAPSDAYSYTYALSRRFSGFSADSEGVEGLEVSGYTEDPRNDKVRGESEVPGYAEVSPNAKDPGSSKDAGNPEDKEEPDKELVQGLLGFRNALKSPFFRGKELRPTGRRARRIPRPGRRESD
uniref:Translocon-associated protein subunit alpha n=1 Tax=Steinernema glaseri TaxID=37863 RepID=A0A1I7Y0M6_9BILA